MKALFLRWLYGLKRPLFIILFGSMALLMFVVVIMMFIMGTTLQFCLFHAADT